MDEFLSTPGYEVRKDKIYDRISEFLLDTFKKAGFDFARYSEITCKDVPQEIMDDILNILLEEKQIVKNKMMKMYTLTSYMETAKEKIREHLKEDPLITIAQVRDMFATSRKSAKPILEYMDSIKVTKKTGAESEKGGILMNLKQLEAFVQVAEGGSFSKAAKQLFLTQPTISAHIFVTGERTECKAFCKKHKRSKIIGRWKGSVPLCETDDRSAEKK